MKGQSPVLTHTIVIGLSLILILVIVLALKNIVDENQKFVAKTEVDNLCTTVKFFIEKAFTVGNYHSPQNRIYGTMIFDLPEKMGNIKYRTVFTGNNLLIETFPARFNATCTINANTTLVGSTSGGKTKIVYTAYANNTREIAVSNM